MKYNFLILALIALITLAVACENEKEEKKPESFILTLIAGEGGSVEIEGYDVTHSEFEEGMEITAKAISDIYYLFENWTDNEKNVVSENENFTFKISKDETLTANFNPDWLPNWLPAIYVGTLKVNENTANEFVLENVETEIKIMENNFLLLNILKVKFAEPMPLLDITIEGIELTKSEDVYSFYGNEIIPIAMGGPFPDFIITEMTGTLTPTTIEFSMICGSRPVNYSGIVQNN